VLYAVRTIHSPQEAPKQSSNAQMIESEVCASPRIDTKYP